MSVYVRRNPLRTVSDAVNQGIGKLLNVLVDLFDILFGVLQRRLGIRSMPYLFALPNLLIFGIFVVGAIIAVTAWISGRSERSGQLAAERDRQSNKVIGGARWAHDQAAMTVLATTDAAALQSTWTAIQAQLFDVEASIAASKVGDPARDSEIALVGRSVGDLRGALAADVALRLSSQGQQYELVEASRRNVLQRNDQLEQALRPLVAAQS